MLFSITQLKAMRKVSICHLEVLITVSITCWHLRYNSSETLYDTNKRIVLLQLYPLPQEVNEIFIIVLLACRSFITILPSTCCDIFYFVHSELFVLLTKYLSLTYMMSIL